MLENRVPVRFLILYRCFKENSNVLSHGNYISPEDCEKPIVSLSFSQVHLFVVSTTFSLFPDRIQFVFCRFCRGSRTPF